MTANERQVGGDHYKGGIQHWDYVWANRLDYFQAQITKYVTRWRKKNGLQDLEKAKHFLEKYIELNKDYCTCGYPGSHIPGCAQFQPLEGDATSGYTNQD